MHGCPRRGTWSSRFNPGIDTVEIHTSHTDAGIIANVGQRVLSYNVVENEVDLSQLGVYVITYEVIHLEERYTLKRYVYVVDETPPVLLLNAGVDTIFVGDAWIDASVTATDNSLESLEVTVTGTVDITTPGVYPITYTASDSSGNTATIIRTVTVIVKVR
jgi:hypothetical protein